MPLTETQNRNLKPASTPKKHFDGEGLFLYVTPAGSKLWRMAYRFEGREKLLSFGKYPTVSLRDARARCERSRKMRISVTQNENVPSPIFEPGTFFATRDWRAFPRSVLYSPGTVPRQRISAL